MFSLIIFSNTPPWDLLSKSERSYASWLTAKHYELRWKDGMIPYYMAKEFITKAVIGTKDNDDDDDDDDDDDNNLYMLRDTRSGNGYKICSRTMREKMSTSKKIDAHYEDMESLNKLDIIHTLRCQKYVTNCALQNVFKLFNWWHQRHQK